MALVTFIQKPKTTTKTGGSTTAWQSLQNQLKTLDIIYKDPFEQKVNDSKYFDEYKKLLTSALYNPALTTNKRQQVANMLLDLEKERWAFEQFNVRLGNSPEEKFNEDLESSWRQMWSTYGALGSQNIPAFSQMMNGKIDEWDTQISYMKKQLEDNGYINTAQYDKIKKLSDLIKEKKRFWNGVELRPDDYVVTMKTSTNGEVEDFKIVNKASVPGGYKYTGTKYGDLKLYALPFLTDDGEEVIKIGNNVFKQSGNIYLFDNKESGVDEPEFSSLNKVQDLYKPGQELRSPDGKIYVVGKNRQVFEYNSLEDYQDKLGMSIDSNANRFVELDPDEAAEIKTNFQIEKIKIPTPQEVRQQEIQEKIEAVARPYKEKPAIDFVKESVMEIPVFGSFLKGSEAFTKIAKSATTGISKGVSRKTGEFVKESITPAAKIVGKTFVEHPGTKAVSKTVSTAGRFLGKVANFFKSGLTTKIKQ